MSLLQKNQDFVYLRILKVYFGGELIKWDDAYYFEQSMPFEARNSSHCMQVIANALLDALSKFGIHGYMYFNDITDKFAPIHQ